MKWRADGVERTVSMMLHVLRRTKPHTIEEQTMSTTASANDVAGLQANGTNTYEVTQPNVAVSLDNTDFDVQSGASLNLTGSSNTVIAESGAGGLNVNGTGNTISGANADGMQVNLNGSGNVLTMGGDGGVGDSGAGDTITIGANSQASLFGSQTTLNATQGNDLIYVQGTGVTVNASNDRVQAWQSFQLNGDGNQVGLSQSTLSLSGNNNTISAGAGSEVVTSSGSLTEAADGSFVGTGNVSAGAVSLTGGVATVQLGNGNVETIDNVVSGTTFDYVDASGATSAFTLTDTDLQHVGGSLYDVTGPVTALMSNTIFDVQSGASLNVTGSSNTVIAENGAGGLNVNGSGNVITGTSTNGMQVGLSGSGNVLTAGTNGGVTDSGAGDTITIGTNSQADLFGSQATLNAKQGGDVIYVENTSSGATVNASNDRVQAWQSFQLNGDGNQVALSQPKTLNLSGSNNTISIVDAGSEVVTSSGSLTETANGTLVGTGNVDASAVSLTGGVATVQLGNGNVATIDNVAAGSTFEQVDASGNGTWTVLQDSGLSSSVSATFDFGTGGGQQTINAVTGAAGSEAGVVDFAPGVTDNQLWFEQVGNNLQVDIIGTQDSLTVNGWFAGDAAVQQFHTADGLTADSQVNQLVAAMASYSSANPGFNPTTATGMPGDSTLQGTVVSAWHH
jgi:trimeric autotransporter adhesin